MCISKLFPGLFYHSDKMSMSIDDKHDRAEKAGSIVQGLVLMWEGSKVSLPALLPNDSPMFKIRITCRRTFVLPSLPVLVLSQNIVLLVGQSGW